MVEYIFTKMATEKEVIEAIKKALEIDREISISDNIDTIEEWDSLGHLSMLIAIDKLVGGRAGKIEELGKAESVNTIIDLLTKNKLIDS